MLVDRAEQREAAIEHAALSVFGDRTVETIVDVSRLIAAYEEFVGPCVPVAEVEKWKRRARRGVTTPPPGWDHVFVRSEQLREACEQRDRAEAEVDRLRSDSADLADDDVEIIREALWHAYQRGDISEGERSRIRALRARFSLTEGIDHGMDSARVSDV